MSAFSKLFGVSLAAVLAASVASAATITYSTPVDFAGIPVTDTYNFSGTFGAGFGPAGNGGGEALPFRKFDPAYGTLTGVSITINGSIGTNADTNSEAFGSESYLSVTNTSGSTQNYSEFYSIRLYLMDNNPTCFAAIEDNFNTGVTEETSGCMLSSMALNFNNTEQLENGQTSTHSLVNAGVMNAFSGITGTITNLSNFVGTGSFPLQIFLESSNLITNDAGNANATFEAFAGVTGSVTYTYDEAATPEPGTMFLTGGALLVVGLLRRKLTR